MARVVQRRGTPPYLLILFVFLFVIATALAVLFYVHDNDKQKLLVERDVALKKVTAERDALQNKVIPGLAQKMTGRNVAPDAAIKDGNEALQLAHALPYAHLGLAPAIKGLNDQIVGDLKRIKELEQREQDLSATLTKKEETITKLKADFDQHVKAVRAELDKARADFTRDLATKDAQLQRASKEKDAIISQREQQIAVLNQEKDTLRGDLDVKNNLVNKLRNDLRKKKQRKPGQWVMRKPDGKIAKVVGEQGIVYIDLGESNNIRPGLPFSVYPRGQGIPEHGEGKAKIIVVNVGANTSECRVVVAPKDDPLVEGDFVANVIYDPGRIQNFVVEGDFDLYGQGRADPTGNRRVRALIERFGGKVTEMVSVDTDFVVMGYEPSRPPQPAEGASPDEWQRYNNQMKKYKHYREILAAAAGLQIPVMNTSRFLAFTGFAPRRTLTE